MRISNIECPMSNFKFRRRGHCQMCEHSHHSTFDIRNSIFFFFQCFHLPGTDFILLKTWPATLFLIIRCASRFRRRRIQSGEAQQNVQPPHQGRGHFRNRSINDRSHIASRLFDFRDHRIFHRISARDPVPRFWSGRCKADPPDDALPGWTENIRLAGAASPQEKSGARQVHIEDACGIAPLQADGVIDIHRPIDEREVILQSRRKEILARWFAPSGGLVIPEAEHRSNGGLAPGRKESFPLQCAPAEATRKYRRVQTRSSGIPAGQVPR